MTEHGKYCPIMVAGGNVHINGEFAKQKHLFAEYGLE